MLTLAVDGARLAQFAGAVVLFGLPLFFLYALPAQGDGAPPSLGWPRPVLGWAVVMLAAGGVAALAAQTAVMTGDAAEAFKPASVADLLTSTHYGKAVGVRLGLELVAGMALLAIRPARGLWLVLAALGAGVLASFAWTGHGAADEGTRGLVHLAGDIVHLLAAAVWLGALAALAMLLLQARPTASPERLAALHGALEGFSGIGSAVVALLLASGLVNSWFLVDIARLGDLVRTPYGLVLTGKVAVFAGMLALAALNRFRLTPRLDRALGGGESLVPAIAALRRSLLLETAAGMTVLVLVSVLGALEPLTTG